jgi:hypothetical protein
MEDYFEDFVNLGLCWLAFEQPIILVQYFVLYLRLYLVLDEDVCRRGMLQSWTKSPKIVETLSRFFYTFVCTTL